MIQMTNETFLRISLLLLRLGVFAVFFMWTLDKFFRPVRHKDFLPEFGAKLTLLVGALELIIVLLFLFGMLKLFSYGLVFALHLISTLSTYERYLNPFEGHNLLYFASWPMLAACATLLLLRAQDTLFTWAQIRRYRNGAPKAADNNNEE